jgi:acetyl esterase/lipase
VALEESRAQVVQLKRTGPVPGVSEHEFFVTHPSGAKLGSLVFWPTDAKADLPVYVLFHPGGWFLGDYDIEADNARTIVKDHNVVVFTPTYRLAPEHPFPAGVDDVWDWTLWIAHQSHILNVHADPKKGFILAGESPGANMAFVSALRARDDPEAMKGVQVTGLHLYCGQLCAPDAIPQEYKKWYTSYEQCKGAPVFNRGVQDNTERRFT